MVPGILGLSARLKVVPLPIVSADDAGPRCVGSKAADKKCPLLHRRVFAGTELLHFNPRQVTEKHWPVVGALGLAFAWTDEGVRRYMFRDRPRHLRPKGHRWNSAPKFSTAPNVTNDLYSAVPKCHFGSMGAKGQGRAKGRKPKMIEDKKIRGEWAESVFVPRATEHGLPVSKPWGEMNSFDFVVGRPGRFASVQVKSTTMRLGTGYQCYVRGGHKAYASGSFDFLAAYVIPDDVWYIIPASVIRGLESISLYPHSPTAKYEQYREAWHLLQEAAGCEEDPLLPKTGRSGAPTPSPTASDDEGAAADLTPMGTATQRMQNAFDFVRRQMEKGGRTPR